LVRIRISYGFYLKPYWRYLLAKPFVNRSVLHQKEATILK